jgi:hypothetical protein
MKFLVREGVTGGNYAEVVQAPKTARTLPGRRTGNTSHRARSRWKKGRRRMPETARMLIAGDLGCFDPEFRGWSIRNGKLISPEGWEATAGDILTIPLTRAQISAHQAKERQVLAMDEQPLPDDAPAIVA